MRRRQYLAATAGVALVAGCLGGGGSGSSDADASSGAGTDPPDRPLPADVELPVPRTELSRGASRDRIPAIVNPAFASDWQDLSIPFRDSSIEPRLAPDDMVIGVEGENEARAYPLRVLNFHEVVNDHLDGDPLLVTYCPLCGSGMVADRLVNGEETRFGVSGLLYRRDLVLYDRATNSLWSQILATAIRGDRTGEQLALRPSTITTWRDWREAHANPQVLLPPPESGTVLGPGLPFDYTDDIYDQYREPDRKERRDGVFPKTTVIGVADGDVTRAYPLPRVERAGVVSDRVGSIPVVVTTTADGTLVAYDRRVDGAVLSLEGGGVDYLRGGGSRWRRTTGVAVDGPHEGARLARANDLSPMFWFAWADFHPETTVYGTAGDENE